TGLMVVMKGLPLAYSKDMQEDKEPVFDAADTLGLCIAAATGMVRDLRFDEARLRQSMEDGFVTATDLADWLVRALNLPFRRAHHVTGELVGKAEARGCDLSELTLAEMQAVEPGIHDEVFTVLGVDNSVASRTSFGGTAPDNVKQAAAAARERFL
ncbi:MAG: argininosuccinate lyase, partial [Rhodospirillales bacterium]|nr:argininosuccinate lyase [Rhodospirillales bacterium]